MTTKASSTTDMPSRKSQGMLGRRRRQTFSTNSITIPLAPLRKYYSPNPKYSVHTPSQSIPFSPHPTMYSDLTPSLVLFAHLLHLLPMYFVLSHSSFVLRSHFLISVFHLRAHSFILYFTTSVLLHYHQMFCTIVLGFLHGTKVSLALPKVFCCYRCCISSFTLHFIYSVLVQLNPF